MSVFERMTRVLLITTLFATGVADGFLPIPVSLHVSLKDSENDTFAGTNCTVRNGCADCSCLELCQIPGNLPENITCLNLRGNDIQGVNGTLLRRYPKLSYLSLSNNSITTIGKTDFKDMATLKMLDLSLNRIKYGNIDGKAFVDLKSLTYLDLKQKIIQYSDATYPKALTEVKQLEELMINGIPSPLPYLLNLKELYLSGQYGRCEIPYISRDLFQNILNIEKIYLSNCSILDVENNAFKNLTYLESLDFSWNTGLTFAPMVNITIGLHRTNFKRLNMNNVVKYYLNDNCTTISYDQVKYILNTSFEVMSFEGNNIVHIDRDTMHHLPPTLKYLSMRDNIQMMSVSTLLVVQLQLLKNLVYYDTSRMFYSHMPPEIKLGTDLENDIPTVDTCKPCHTLFTRNEVNTFFEVLDERLKRFNITPVGVDRQSTHAEHNAIEYLDLSETLSDSYILMFKLFNNPKTIRFLNMSGTYLGYALIDNGTFFDKFVGLTTLDISSNGILTLKEQVFDKLFHLQQLYLGNNKIVNITFNINLLRNLMHLDLHSNHLEVLDKKTMKELDQLPKITINMVDNTLLCSCTPRNLNFIQWMTNTRTKFENFDQMHCLMEKNESLMSMSDFNFDQFKTDCQPPKFEILTLVTSLCILTFLLIVFVGLVYRYRWNLRYLYYMTKFKLAGGYRQVDNGDYERDIFVSYADEDRTFVREQVLPNLEDTGEFSLLVHGRDFLAGEFVADNIVRAVTSTRRTLVILTKAYIQSEWCMYELNIARMECVNANRNVLCVIIKEEVPVRSLPIEVVDLIRSKTYMEFPDSLEDQNDFWKRLKLTLR